MSRVMHVAGSRGRNGSTFAQALRLVGLATALCLVMSGKSAAQDFDFGARPQNIPTSGGVQVGNRGVTGAATNPHLFFTVALGGGGTSTGSTTTGAASAGLSDAVLGNSSRQSAVFFVGGIGFTDEDILSHIHTGYPPEGTLSRYAPEAEKTYAADFPIKAPPASPAPPPRRITIGLEGNFYAFAGAKSTINGIPGGPFGTATGSDSLNFRDNFMFTVGAAINIPVNTWTFSVTGGFAEANKTVTFNCVTFCAVAPATVAFSDSKDVWLPGGYVGARLQAPFAIPSLLGARISLDYKHAFLATRSVTLGNSLTRSVTLNVSQDIDLFTVRLAIPLL